MSEQKDVRIDRVKYAVIQRANKLCQWLLPVANERETMT